MLHRCPDCLQLYITSRYHDVCDYCGGQQFQRLELTEEDSAIDWWILAAQAEFGMEVEKMRVWWVG